jgi:hypothetical protein
LNVRFQLRRYNPFNNDSLGKSLITIQDARSQIAEKGFVLIRGESLVSVRDLGSDLIEFMNSWDHLVQDPYLPRESQCRWRRYNRFLFDPVKGTLEASQDLSFYQSKAINAVAGDIVRQFAAMDPYIRSSNVLRNLVDLDFSMLPLNEHDRRRVWDVSVHQIRIIGEPGRHGNPTPEGVHRDGHLYVGQHLMRRDNVAGGISVLCDDHDRPFDAAILSTPLDTIIVDDVKIKHFASPIQPRVLGNPAVRDMLLVDYRSPIS